MQNALPLGRAFDSSQLYCQGLFQHLTALFIIIAYSDVESKKMKGLHFWCRKRILTAAGIKTWAYINYVSYWLDRISDTSRVNVSSRHLFLSSHSQTTITFQPDLRRSSLLRLSRAAFPRILGPQYSWLEDGQTKRGQSCLCQKHPFTKITVWYLGRTISGQPGKLRTFLR